MPLFGRRQPRQRPGITDFFVETDETEVLDLLRTDTGREGGDLRGTTDIDQGIRRLSETSRFEAADRRNQEQNEQILEQRRQRRENQNQRDINAFKSRVEDTTFEQALADADRGLTFEDNPLTEFPNSSYKFTLFVNSIESFNQGDPRRVDSNDQIILAESGNSARYFLQEVQIDSISSPTMRTRNMPLNQFSLTIMEPKGTSFMDALFTACRTLDIPNHFVAPYYLQLDFIAYNEDGEPIHLPEYSKIWGLKIIDIQAGVTGEGTTYDVSAIEYEHVATSNRNAIMPVNFSFKASTVAEFFDELETRMNRYQLKTSFKDRLTIDEFKFNVDPEISQLKTFSPGSNKEDPQFMGDPDFFDMDTKVFNVPRGVDVGAVVDKVMLSNIQWTTEHLVKDPNKDGLNKKKINQSARIWVVETDIEFLQFDPKINDYARRYIFNIIPYNSSRDLTTSDVVVDKYNDEAEQRRRLAEIKKLYFTNKRYDYIYTGQNTEIINFDISLNYMWVGSLPLFGGVDRFNPYGQGTGYSEIVRRSRDSEDKSHPAFKAQTQRRLDRFGFRQGPPLPPPDILTRNGAEANNSTGINNNDPEDVRENQLATNSRERQNNTEDNRFSLRNRVFVEDLETLETQQRVPEDSRSREKSNINRTPLALPYTTAHDGSGVDVDGAYIIDGSGKWLHQSVAGALLNNVYENSAEQLQIDMEIRGDPFWLGRSRTEERLGLLQNDRIFLDDSRADNMFLLRYRLPEVQETPEGLQNISDSDVITGFFSVLNVSSIFASGQFTQILSAYRDASSNVRFMLKEFNN